MEHTTESTLSLSDFQRRNRLTYERQNNLYYPTQRLFLRLNKFVAQLLRDNRTGNIQFSPYHLSMAFSWLLALVNRLGIDNFEFAVHTQFGWCQSMTLTDIQRMCAPIYTKNALEGSLSYLAEEIGELAQALDHFLATSDPRILSELTYVLVNFFTRLMVVANCLTVDLASQMEREFPNGHCPKCSKNPKCNKEQCGCDPTVKYVV